MTLESAADRLTVMRKLPIALLAGVGFGLVIGMTLWVGTALASGSATPPAAVQSCASSTGVVVFAPSGTCPAATTAIAPLASQSGGADLTGK